MSGQVERSLTPKEKEIASMTWLHIARVGALMAAVVRDLVWRMTEHDHSKVELPEAEGFAVHTETLRGLTYGSDEYKAALEALGPTLAHHYACNRHHPEHFPDGIEDMTLMDVVEMVCDWKAATERHANGDILKSIEHNTERFKMSPQLARVIRNTVLKMNWTVKEVGS
jgi:hypothetical protein